MQAEEQQYVLWGPSHVLYPQQDQLIENCLYYGNAQGHPYVFCGGQIRADLYSGSICLSN